MLFARSSQFQIQENISMVKYNLSLIFLTKYQSVSKWKFLSKKNYTVVIFRLKELPVKFFLLGVVMATFLFSYLAAKEAEGNQKIIVDSKKKTNLKTKSMALMVDKEEMEKYRAFELEQDLDAAGITIDTTQGISNEEYTFMLRTKQHEALEKALIAKMTKASTLTSEANSIREVSELLIKYYNETAMYNSIKDKYEKDKAKEISARQLREIEHKIEMENLREERYRESADFQRAIRRR